MRNWTQIGFSSIYYVLKRLEKSGLITGSTEAVEGKPSRRNYTITVSGYGPKNLSPLKCTTWSGFSAIQTSVSHEI